MQDTATTEQLLFRKWMGMLYRCGHAGRRVPYQNYAALGINVCEEWRGSDGFARFREWALENEFSPGLFIDRIDTYGDYCPTNCRFTTQAENNANRTDTVFIEYEGRVLKLNELCRAHGVEPGLVYGRLRNGWSVTRALTEPRQIRRSRRTLGIPKSQDLSKPRRRLPCAVPSPARE